MQVLMLKMIILSMMGLFTSVQSSCKCRELYPDYVRGCWVTSTRCPQTHLDWCKRKHLFSDSRRDRCNSYEKSYCGWGGCSCNVFGCDCEACRYWAADSEDSSTLTETEKAESDDDYAYFFDKLSDKDRAVHLGERYCNGADGSVPVTEEFVAYVLDVADKNDDGDVDRAEFSASSGTLDLEDWPVDLRCAGGARASTASDDQDETEVGDAFP